MNYPARGGPSLSEKQQEQLQEYARELGSMNRRINLVSREDVGSIATRHIPHCLTLASRRFEGGSLVVDWGTGGGLPLIPLAVAFPNVGFIGVDAVVKKVQAVRHFARRLGLANVDAWHGRAEAFQVQIDYSVSRATAPLVTLWDWHLRVVRDLQPGDHDDTFWPRGSLVCLKGGELDEEVSEIRDAVHVDRRPVAELIPDPYFASKEIVCVTATS